MKKKSLLFLTFPFFLAGCNINLPFLNNNKTNQSGKKVEHIQEVTEITDEGPEELTQHATAMKGDPNNPFFLKVGERRVIQAKPDPNPTLDEEKVCTWAISGDADSIRYEVDTTDSRKVTIEGLKVGKAQLVATNVYNPLLSKTFVIRVIDYNEETHYKWEYRDGDIKKFSSKDGYTYLSGMEWKYERAKGVVNDRSYHGSLPFGKSTEPETDLKLIAKNSRKVLSVLVEAASTHSQSKMEVKVGDKTYLNKVAVEEITSSGDEVFKFYESNSEIEPVSGDITIHVETPEKQQTTSGEYDRNSPGAFYLKSITIIFKDAEFVDTKTFNFREMYNDENDTILHTLATDTDTSVKFNEGNYTVYLNSVKKPKAADAEKIPNLVFTKSYIDITLSKTDEVISYVELKIDYGSITSNAKNVYSLEVSKCGRSPYSACDYSSNIDGLLSIYVYANNVNSIRLNVKNSYNVGLDYLTIKTRSGAHATIKEIAEPETFVPTKTEYIAGEHFNPEGLNNLTIVYNEQELRDDVLLANELKWVDGVSYDKNAATASEILDAGTTYVYGIFNDEFAIKVEGITVTNPPLTVVKDVSTINANGRYYLICREHKKLVKSSAGANIKSDTAIATLSLDTIAETIELGKEFAEDYFILLPQENGKIRIQSPLGQFVGMADNGNISCSKSAANKDYTITIDDETGVATMEITSSANSSVTRYLGFNVTEGKIQLTAEEVSNLSFYIVN